MFHRRFPDRWTYPVAIAKLYKAHGITSKRVKILKAASSQTIERHISQLNTCKYLYQEALNEGIPIVFLDETVFSKTTIR